ncbi:hypothetical protein Q7I41_20530, partial [Aeromonas allosaccharophila]
SCAAQSLVSENAPMETITHPTLVQLVAAGAVRVVVAVGQPSGWPLLVRYGLAERALAAQRIVCGLSLFNDQVRAFFYSRASIFAVVFI